MMFWRSKRTVYHRLINFGLILLRNRHLERSNNISSFGRWVIFNGNFLELVNLGYYNMNHIIMAYTILISLRHGGSLIVREMIKTATQIIGIEKKMKYACKLFNFIFRVVVK